MIFTWWINYWSVELWLKNYLEIDFIDGPLWIAWWILEFLRPCLPRGPIHRSLDTLLFFNDVAFISPFCLHSFILIHIICLHVFAWQGLKYMVEEKWLDEKGASGEDFKSLFWDQGDMRNDNFHLGVVTLVNQSVVNNHLCVLSMNSYGP